MISGKGHNLFSFKLFTAKVHMAAKGLSLNSCNTSIFNANTRLASSTIFSLYFCVKSSEFKLVYHSLPSPGESDDADATTTTPSSESLHQGVGADQKHSVPDSKKKEKRMLEVDLKTKRVYRETSDNKKAAISTIKSTSDIVATPEKVKVNGNHSNWN